MTRRRRPIHWFRIVLLIALIAIAVYVNKVVVPTVPPPFVATATATRDPASYVAEAQKAFDDGKLLQSIAAYDQAISTNPDDPAVYVARARVQIFAGKYEEALISANRALLLNPDNSMAHAVRGWALLRLGDLANAEISIVRALELDPNNGLAHAYYAELLGSQYINNIGPLDVVDLFSAESNLAIQLAPNSIEAHRARGYILYITSNYEDAVPEYKAAIELNPNIPDLHIDLGLTYRALGLIDDAVQEYTLANTLNPSDPRPDLYASRALASVGSYGLATQYAEGAVGTDPIDPYLRGNLGVMLYKSVDMTKAVVQLGLAVDGGTTEDGQTIPPLVLTAGDARAVETYYFYALALAYTRRCDRVLQVSQQILTVAPLDETAVFNANAAIAICQQIMLTPAPVPTGTATQGTATPGVYPTP
jgi:tetratricopeptide (TPR) repeat protein